MSSPRKLRKRRVRAEILWIRSGGDIEQFRRLLQQPGVEVDSVPLALMICENLSELSDDVFEQLDVRLKANKGSPAEMALLAVSESSLDQALAASSERCPAELLEALSDHSDDMNRSRVAANMACPERVLRKLARDLDPRVRVAVGLNEATPPDVIREMRHDENEDVRITIDMKHGAAGPGAST